MRGELIGVWSEMWRQVWKKLADHKDAPNDIFCELYRELNTARAARLDPATELADIVDDQEQARVAFRDTKATALKGEVAVLKFLERAHTVIEDFDSAALTNRYFKLIRDFLEKYSLRYDLRRPFSLHPTLPGIFARLMRDLRLATNNDAILSAQMHAFEETIRDLKADRSPHRINACIHAQMNLLEALAQRCPGVTAGTLGAMCGQLNTWPHAAVKAAISNLYGFASNYPLIRHGGKPKSALREIEMRDMVSISIVLAGFTPYLTDLIDSNRIFSD